MLSERELENDLQNRPLVFDIVRGSFDDGPGMRTVIFLKGCPLHCPWCQNPEAQSARRETFFYPEKCINCGLCRDGDDSLCNSLAKQVVGTYYPPAELAHVIARDKPFYDNSGGGVTFSGGEPLQFIDYLLETVTVPRMENIQIAVETCGYFNFAEMQKKLLPHIGLFLFDIKIMDEHKHKTVIGRNNRIIIENFKKLLAAGVEVLPRVPLIPGYVATKENLAQIAFFFKQLKIKKYALLPYNPSGLDKWPRLSKSSPPAVDAKPMTMKEEQDWILFFQECLKQ